MTSQQRITLTAKDGLDELHEKAEISAEILYNEKEPPLIMPAPLSDVDVPAPAFYPTTKSCVPEESTSKLFSTLDDIQNTFIKPTSLYVPGTKEEEKSPMTFSDHALTLTKHLLSDINSVEASICEMIDAHTLNLKSILQTVQEGVSEDVPFSFGPYDPNVGVIPVVQSADYPSLDQIEGLFADNKTNIARFDENQVPNQENETEEKKSLASTQFTVFSSVGTTDSANGGKVALFSLSIDELIAKAQAEEEEQRRKEELQERKAQLQEAHEQSLGNIDAVADSWRDETAAAAAAVAKAVEQAGVERQNTQTHTPVQNVSTEQRDFSNPFSSPSKSRIAHQDAAPPPPGKPTVTHLVVGAGIAAQKRTRRLRRMLQEEEEAYRQQIEQAEKDAASKEEDNSKRKEEGADEEKASESANATHGKEKNETSRTASGTLPASDVFFTTQLPTSFAAQVALTQAVRRLQHTSDAYSSATNDALSTISEMFPIMNGAGNTSTSSPPRYSDETRSRDTDGRLRTRTRRAPR